MRALLAVCVMAAGCYDVDDLSRSFDAATQSPGDGGAADLSGDAGPGGWRSLPSPTTQTLRGVFGSGGGEVFAVGANSTVVRMSTSHDALKEASGPGYNLRAVWANAGSAIAVGDDSAVLTRAGSGWTGAAVNDSTLYGVTGGATDELFAVGSAGTLMHKLPGGWINEDSGVTVHLRGVWVRPSAEVIIAGEGGTILRGTGSAPLTWATENVGSADLFAVWSSTNDSFVVGAGGLVLHASAGGAWSPETSGTTSDLFGVFGIGDQVWGVGAGGTVVHRSGGAWQLERSGGPDLRAVWAASLTEVWAVGDSGTLLLRAP